jgi:hypothetical protein
LQKRYGPLPRSWGSLTADGEHYWLRLPKADIRGGNDKLGAGIDVKTGRGSYVVAPPSLHPSGVRYEWRSDGRPAETRLAIAPTWLIDLLTPPPPPPEKEFKRRDDDDRRVAEALMAIPVTGVRRDDWIRIGMALKAHFGEAGLALWDQWSRRSDFYDRKGLERAWKSFRGSGVGIGSIFWLAGRFGCAA